MIDKAAQRARAEQLSQSLAAQGLVAPKLTYPAPTPKPAPKGPSDKVGTEFAVGQRVARASTSDRSAVLSIQTVTRVEDGKVYLDKSPVALRVLRNVLVLK